MASTTAPVGAAPAVAASMMTVKTASSTPAPTPALTPAPTLVQNPVIPTTAVKKVAPAAGPSVPATQPVPNLSPGFSLFGKTISKQKLYMALAVVLLLVLGYVWWCGRQEDRRQREEQKQRVAIPAGMSPEQLQLQLLQMQRASLQNQPVQIDPQLLQAIPTVQAKP